MRWEDCEEVGRQTLSYMSSLRMRDCDREQHTAIISFEAFSTSVNTTAPQGMTGEGTALDLNISDTTVALGDGPTQSFIYLI